MNIQNTLVNLKYDLKWKWRRFKNTYLKLTEIRAKRALRNGLYEIYENYESLGINNVKVSRFRRPLRVTISLSRSGLLIGRQGKSLNELREYLEKVMKIPVKIHIVEFNPLDY